MSDTKAPLGFGLYFIDVLACLLFSITLALATARFDRETLVPVELPRIERSAAALDVAPELGSQWVTLRAEGEALQLYLGEDEISFDALAQRLAAAPPPALVVRSEGSPLARVIAMAHAAGVADVHVAYEDAAQAEDSR